MDRKHVNSSDLKSVGYDEKSQILEIEFNNGAFISIQKYPKSIRKLMGLHRMVSFSCKY